MHLRPWQKRMAVARRRKYGWQFFLGPLNVTRALELRGSMTQKNIAELLGVTPTTIWRLFNNRTHCKTI